MGRKGIGCGGAALTMCLRRRWLALLLVGTTLFFLGTAFYLPTEHGRVTPKDAARSSVSYARKMTKAAPNAVVAELTQEQRRQRQERLDRELRAVEADHESIVHAMYPHPENGTCFGEINIITQFPVLPEVLPELGELKSAKDAEAIGNDRRYAIEKGPLHRRRRQEEYLDTLRKNLRNPHVKRIHLLLERESDMEFILSQGMPDVCGKLQPVPLGRWMHYRDAFEYAATKLPGELCMVMNADIYLAQGWQFATKALFERKKVPHVYVLARWEGPSVFCVEKPEDSCTTRARVGSYDAFVFLSPLPLDEGDLKAIDYQQNIWGAENRVLNVLHMNQLGVSNPCKILQVGHNHCDAFFRPQQGMHEGQYRVPAGRARMAPYTATL